MGIKGDKLSNAASLAADLIKERLNTIEGITSRKMFSGYGIFHDGKMFGLINSGGNLYLKVDDSNRGQFEAAGCPQHGKMPYYQVPEEVTSNRRELLAWAKGSMAVSM